MPFAAAAIGAVGTVAAAGASMYGASQAAGAAKSAANLQQARYNTTRGDLDPYNQAGQVALLGENALAGSGPTGGGPDFVGQAYANLPGTMTQAQLEATPGYQFTLSQGLKAVQSAAAARGLGMSGASVKGAADYATGLASQTYQQQFNIQQQQFADYGSLNSAQQGNLTNQFNRYNALAGLGENAAAQLGNTGANLANQAGTFLSQAGLDSAAGTTGASNALTGGVNNALAYYNQQQLLNGQTTGYTGPSASALTGGSAGVGSPAYIQGQLGVSGSQLVP